MIKSGISPREAATYAVKARNTLKIKARNQGPKLFKKIAQKMSKRKYHNNVGPTSTAAIKDAGGNYQKVIDNSGSTNKFINFIFGAK